MSRRPSEAIGRTAALCVAISALVVLVGAVAFAYSKSPDHPLRTEAEGGSSFFGRSANPLKRNLGLFCTFVQVPPASLITELASAKDSTLQTIAEGALRDLADSAPPAVAPSVATLQEAVAQVRLGNHYDVAAVQAASDQILAYVDINCPVLQPG